jgi:replicative DNA helicase
MRREANHLEVLSATDRLPPQNLEAEEATLGAMMLERDAIAQVIELLEPDDFYRDANRHIYETIVHLFSRGEPADLVSVTHELRRRNLLETIGGIPYLQTLIERVPIAANVEYYANLVKEKALLRKLLHAAHQIATWCYEEGANPDETLDRAERAIFSIAQRRIRQGLDSIQPLLKKVFDEADHRFHARSAITGLSSGFPDLDLRTAGFQKADLIIVAARPGMGKTSFVLNIAQHVAIHERVPVAIFSLEMSKEQLVQGMICSLGRVDWHRWRTGHFRQEDWTRIARAIEKLYHAPIYIDDTPAITPMEMRAKARRLQAEHGLGLIVVDYLQLMRSGLRLDNRVQEISEITRALKSLAKELNVPLIACAQLSRAVEARPDKRPMLSDLRESGQIEADADLVLFIYRPEYYQRREEENPLEEGAERAELAEIIIGKHRNGPTGMVELNFLKHYRLFVSLERGREVA